MATSPQRRHPLSSARLPSPHLLCEHINHGNQGYLDGQEAQQFKMGGQCSHQEMSESQSPLLSPCLQVSDRLHLLDDVSLP